MKNLFARLLLSGPMLLGLAFASAAQTGPPPAAYTGPRFPGGPDSLRALVYRGTRLATPAPVGRMLVQFELKPDGQPYNFSMVRPPDPLRRPLVDATAAALNYKAAALQRQPVRLSGINQDYFKVLASDNELHQSFFFTFDAD